MAGSGDVLSLFVEKPAAGGRMIARADRLIVLVAGAIPGERVRARIERVGKGVAYATAVAIDEPSTDRRPSTGDPLCGGCLYAHVEYRRQLTLKADVLADAFARIAHIALPAPVPVAASREDGYRMRARLHVRGTHVGFFREGTHELCEVRQTGQLLPASADAVDRLVAAAQTMDLPPLVDVELAENVNASDRVVHLNADGPIDTPALKRLSSGLALSGLSSRAGLHGDPHVVDELSFDGASPIRIRRHVLAFFQGNRYLLNDLISGVLAQVEHGRDIVDLYAGVGLFAMAAASSRGAHVIAVEGDRQAAADLAANAVAAEGAVVARHESVEEYLRRRHAGDVAAIIVDPPRSGMSREAVEGIVRLQAPRIVFVSCDVATLARDARRFTDAGYAIAHVEAYDLFPNTPHVETVAVFQRA